jgi:hypothetical protein
MTKDLKRRISEITTADEGDQELIEEYLTDFAQSIQEDLIEEIKSYAISLVGKKCAKDDFIYQYLDSLKGEKESK